MHCYLSLLKNLVNFELFDLPVHLHIAGAFNIVFGLSEEGTISFTIEKLSSALHENLTLSWFSFATLKDDERRSFSSDMAALLCYS